MAESVQMPKQGNTVEECLLAAWKVKEGDTVRPGDVLCAIETDKASFDVESTAGGTVLKLLARAGDLIPVLTDIAVIGRPGEKIAAAPASPGMKPAADAVQASAPPAPPPTAAASVCAPIPSGEFRAVSPRARRIAEKFGIAAAVIAGSGPGGRVTSRDVKAALDNGPAVKASRLAREVMAATGRIPGTPTGIGGLCRARDLGTAATPRSREDAPETIPYSGIRKLIGDRMRQSLLNHAQLTLSASADALALVELHKAYKKKTNAGGMPKISINDIVCQVVARTLPGFPEVNAVIDINAGVIARHRRVNLAFAVDTPRGLMVPVVTDAHLLSLGELSTAIARHAEDCRKGSINPDFLAGGTFTVSNLGGMGVESFTPVLNSPQVAILGVCAITNVPAPAAGGGFAFRPRIGLSLTIDHQAVDGAPAARFLRAIATGIENLRPAPFDNGCAYGQK